MLTECEDKISKKEKNPVIQPSDEIHLQSSLP